MRRDAEDVKISILAKDPGGYPVRILVADYGWVSDYIDERGLLDDGRLPGEEPGRLFVSPLDDGWLAVDTGKGVCMEEFTELRQAVAWCVCDFDGCDAVRPEGAEA